MTILFWSQQDVFLFGPVVKLMNIRKEKQGLETCLWCGSHTDTLVGNRPHPCKVKPLLKAFESVSCNSKTVSGMFTTLVH